MKALFLTLGLVLTTLSPSAFAYKAGKLRDGLYKTESGAFYFSIQKSGADAYYTLIHRAPRTNRQKMRKGAILCSADNTPCKLKSEIDCDDLRIEMESDSSLRIYDSCAEKSHYFYLI